MTLEELIDSSIDAIKRRDALGLRKISSQALSEAAIEGHREMILLALIDYSLSKILSKLHYQKTKESFYQKIEKKLLAAKKGPKEKRIAALEDAEDLVMKLDESEGNFTANVVDKAKIKKAAALYDKGFSLRRAAEMTGANPTGVLEYVGASKTHEFSGSGKNARRLEIARGVFEG